MAIQKTTTKQNGKARLSLVGFVELTKTKTLIVRVPDATYLLSSDAWGALRIRGQSWGTEISRFILEDEMASHSVHWSAQKGAVIIEDLVDDRKFCLRFDDLMAIAQGQQIPVYGRDNPAWKYRSPIIAEMEKALPVVA